MMYDAVIVEVLECALSRASSDYLKAEELGEKEKSSRILCEVVDRAEKLVSIQDERRKEETKLEAAKVKDKEELKLKWRQLEESIATSNKEFEYKLKALDEEAEKIKAQRTTDIWKYAVSSTISVLTIATAFWFDGKGNMFTSTKGKKIVDDGSNLRNFYK